MHTGFDLSQSCFYARDSIKTRTTYEQQTIYLQLPVGFELTLVQLFGETLRKIAVWRFDEVRAVDTFEVFDQFLPASIQQQSVWSVFFRR